MSEIKSIVEKLAKYKSEATIRKYVSGLTPEECREVVAYLDDAYYNGQAKCPDAVYDIIRDHANAVAGTSTKVGSKLRDEIQKVELPFWLGSMTKLKEEAEIERWCMRNRAFGYVCTEKLDGVSCLLLSDELGRVRMYTRGDGAVGADISFLRPHIKGLPKTIPSSIAVRGELLMRKEDFVKHEKEYSNARNMVSGIVNAKTLKAGVQDISFVAYEIIQPDGRGEPVSEQLDKLSRAGFDVVSHVIWSELDNERLLHALRAMRQSSRFEIDGIVVYADSPYTRNTSGNPDYAFAFKTNEESAKVVTTVRAVQWNLSRHSYYTPVVQFEPVKCGGVTIKQASGSNAKNIVQMGIGPGARIEVVRSGDVIPYISRVLEKATDIPFPSKYEWTESGVDIFLPSDEQSDDIEKRRMLHFFTTLEIPLLSEGTVSKLYDAGFRTLPKVLALKQEQLNRLPGFGDTSAANIVKAIHSVRSVALYKLMAASSVFGVGFGLKKSKRLTDAFPNLLEEDVDPAAMAKLEYFSAKSAEQFIPKIEEFRRFYNDLKMFISVQEEAGAASSSSQDLKGKAFVFTGFRDSALESAIVARGGEMKGSVSKKTSYVVTPNPSEGTSKLKDAEKHGVPVISPDQLRAMLQ